MVSAHGLGPLEMQVLGLFERSGPQTVSGVQQLLASKGSELAYTTVMTVLSRLHEKGAISRKKEGKRFVYSATRGTAALKNGVLKRVRAALFQGRGVAPVTALRDAEQLSAEELLELRRWVNARLREQPK
jgi:BlaI family penicillinase repressor